MHFSSFGSAFSPSQILKFYERTLLSLMMDRVVSLGFSALLESSWRSSLDECRVSISDFMGIEFWIIFTLYSKFDEFFEAFGSPNKSFRSSFCNILNKNYLKLFILYVDSFAFVY
jgi:hypothetical protein